MSPLELSDGSSISYGMRVNPRGDVLSVEFRRGNDHILIDNPRHGPLEVSGSAAAALAITNDANFVRMLDHKLGNDLPLERKIISNLVRIQGQLQDLIDGKPAPTPHRHPQMQP